MSWKCPSCGRQNFTRFKNCRCGYLSKEVFRIKQSPLSSQDASGDGLQCFDTPSNCSQSILLQEPLGTQELHPLESPESIMSMPHEELLKEIGSWLFTFSNEDCCIYISTPALQSFRLKVTLEDLEDLLEFLYQKTGSKMTIRKIGLEPTDIVEMIDRVDRMIEGKKSKFSLQFTNDELQEITDIINLQLKA